MVSVMLIQQVILFALLTGPLIALCDEYCSQIDDRNLILNKFEECRGYINKPVNSTNIHEHLISILYDIEIQKNDNLFMKMMHFVQILNDQHEFKNCFDNEWCSLFKNCEFPMNFQFENFNQISKQASHIASILTAFTTNENQDNKPLYLTPHNIEAQLNLAVLDNKNIIEAKIILRKLAEKNQDFTVYYAITNKKSKVVSFKRNNFEMQNNDNKKLKWYYKWDSNKQPLKSNNDSEYISSTQFDSIKYVSGITFDCETSMWKKVVSVPFVYPDGTIR